MRGSLLDGVLDSRPPSEGVVIEASRQAPPATPFMAALQRAQNAQKAAKGTKGGGSNFNPSKHPRGSKGTSQGGKFIASGAAGTSVKGVQRRVGAQQTGKFDNATTAAVKAFQAKYGLKVDGVVGTQTATALLGNPKGAKGVAPGALAAGQAKALAGGAPKKGRSGGRGRGRSRKVAAPARAMGGVLASVIEAAEPVYVEPEEPVEENFRQWAESMVTRVGRGHVGGGRFAPKGGGGAAPTVLPHAPGLLPGKMSIPQMRQQRAPLHHLPKLPESKLHISSLGPGPWDARVQHAVQAMTKGAAKDTQAVHRQDGFFRQERIALHHRQTKLLLQGAQHHEHPVATFLAGGPASGKSELIADNKVKLPKDAVLINPDVFKEMTPEYHGLKAAGNPHAAAMTHEESSYVAKVATGIALGRRHNVTLDAVGDSEKGKFLSKIKAAQEKGHKVKVVYATVPTDVAAVRAEKRGQKTGRFVPEPYLREAHANVSKRFLDEIAPDKSIPFEVYDTSVRGKPQLLASRTEGGGSMTIHDKPGFERFAAKAKEGAKGPAPAPRVAPARAPAPAVA